MRIVCQGHRVKVHAKLLGKSLNFQCLKCADINAEEEHKFRLETIFYLSLEHKIGSRVSVHDACLTHMANTSTMQGLNPTDISSAGNHTFMKV